MDVQTDFYDVFLFDSDFTIIRPKRYYRQGINILSGHAAVRHIKLKNGSDTNNNINIPERVDTDNPFSREIIVRSGEGQGSKAHNMHDETEHEASQHTFYIVNSQRKLKLVAKNAVGSLFLFALRGKTNQGTEANASVHCVNGKNCVSVCLDQA